MYIKGGNRSRRKKINVLWCMRGCRTCVECGVQRTLAIEVKLIFSDRGRSELLDLIAWYNSITAVRSPGDGRKLYARLGTAAVIAFPNQFATSFGEFGSVEWRKWALEFKKRGIKARCCHIHWLDYLQNATLKQNNYIIPRD